MENFFLTLGHPALKENDLKILGNYRLIKYFLAFM